MVEVCARCMGGVSPLSVPHSGAISSPLRGHPEQRISGRLPRRMLPPGRNCLDSPTLDSQACAPGNWKLQVVNRQASGSTAHTRYSRNNAPRHLLYFACISMKGADVSTVINRRRYNAKSQFLFSRKLCTHSVCMWPVDPTCEPGQYQAGAARGPGGQGTRRRPLHRHGNVRVSVQSFSSKLKKW